MTQLDTRSDLSDEERHHARDILLMAGLGLTLCVAAGIYVLEELIADTAHQAAKVIPAAMESPENH